MLVYCSNCGTELPDGVSFCDVCGTPVRGKNGSPAGAPAMGVDPNAGPGASANSANGIGSTSCPVCGAATLPGEAFCDNCGAALLTPTAYTPVAPSQAEQSYSAPPAYSQNPMPSASTGGGYVSPRVITASFVISQPPPPATIQIPDRPELIVGRSDPQS
ncbi:MAG TPA: zinc ribbon domain-containing protein, partial [Chloroflexia bacterium]|nr:zinc ribbon domain-containing protein [Chloroflexia bacterium]